MVPRQITGRKMNPVVYEPIAGFFVCTELLMSTNTAGPLSGYAAVKGRRLEETSPSATLLFLYLYKPDFNGVDQAISRFPAADILEFMLGIWDNLPIVISDIVSMTALLSGKIVKIAWFRSCALLSETDNLQHLTDRQRS